MLRRRLIRRVSGHRRHRDQERKVRRVESSAAGFDVREANGAAYQGPHRPLREDFPASSPFSPSWPSSSESPPQVSPEAGAHGGKIIDFNDTLWWSAALLPKIGSGLYPIRRQKGPETLTDAPCHRRILSYLTISIAAVWPVWTRSRTPGGRREARACGLAGKDSLTRSLPNVNRGLRSPNRARVGWTEESGVVEIEDEPWDDPFPEERDKNSVQVFKEGACA